MSLAAPKNAHGLGADFLQVADHGACMSQNDGHKQCVMTATSKAMIFASIGMWAEGT